MVEAAGVEPASENLLIQLSPGAVYLLGFPRGIPGKQGIPSVAFFFMTASKAKGLCTFTAEMTPEREPRYSHAGWLHLGSDSYFIVSV